MKINGMKSIFLSMILTTTSFAGSDQTSFSNKMTATISPSVFDMAKKNENWKAALVTGRDAQVVFMNITPATNPDNEIGMETHAFDQVIFVVDGQAKSVLDGKESTVTAGDMIFIPQGVPHNFINLDAKKPFKIISVYSATDIPVSAVYKKKSDMPQND